MVTLRMGSFGIERKNGNYLLTDTERLFDILRDIYSQDSRRTPALTREPENEECDDERDFKLND
jgi:hypothetical protein